MFQFRKPWQRHVHATARSFPVRMLPEIQAPEMFVVLAELNARAMREPLLRAIFNKNDRKWKAFLTEILETGMQRNEFKTKVLPKVAAQAIISMTRGLTMTCAGRPELMRRPLYQVLSWLEGPGE